MMVVLDQFVRRSRLGRGIRAVAQDPEAAALMGVNRDRVIQVTFLLGGVMAGAAAALYMMRIGVTRLTPASSSASRRSPPPSSAASATCAGRSLGGLRPRAGRELRVGALRHPVEGRRRVRPAGRDPAVPAHRPAGRVAREGTRMSIRTHRQCDRVRPPGRAAGSAAHRGLVAAGPIVLVPLFLCLRPAAAEPPIITTAGLRLRRGAVHRGDLRPGGARAEHRRRLRRPARPRLRRLLRHRRLHGRGPRRPQHGTWPFLLLRPARGRRHDGLRRHARRPDPAGARRLPRHRDARVRRDHPADRGQHRLARRGRRHHRGAPAARASTLFDDPAPRLGRRAAAGRPRQQDHVPEVRRLRPDPLLLARAHGRSSSCCSPTS